MVQCPALSIVPTWTNVPGPLSVEVESYRVGSEQSSLGMHNDLDPSPCFAAFTNAGCRPQARDAFESCLHWQQVFVIMSEMGEGEAVVMETARRMASE